MSARSVSGGVQGLRAKFEQSNNSDTSPPSRGRSPAGSITSDSSRPISKVRTSFISVERSGQQGLAPPKMSTTEGIVAGDNAPNDVVSKMNGSAEPTIVKEQNTPFRVHDGDGAADIEPANPDMPTTGVEKEPTDLLSEDPKDEGAVSGGSALKPTQEDLGSVLKGSPFRETSDQSVELPEPSKAEISIEPPSTSEAKEDRYSKVNGQPKTPGSANKQTPTSSTKKSGAARPPAVDTRKTPLSASKSYAPKSADKTSKSPRTPQTQQSTSSSAKRSPNIPSPRQMDPSKASSSNATVEGGEAPDQSTRQPSQAFKSSTTAASRARQTSSNTTKVTGKKGTQAPLTTKPRPKSPTRTVRLPSAATAPTQASAAKHEELPTRSPSRASVASNAKAPTSTSNRIRPSAASTAGIQSRPRPPRASLPPQTTASQKPKPRTSTASTKADGGSFLERMMRPTESSSKKTHEKVEVKSPPRKTGPPKRKSDSHRETKEPHKTKAAAEEPRGTEQVNGTAIENIRQEPEIAVEEDTPRANADAKGAEQETEVANADGPVSEPVEPAQ